MELQTWVMGTFCGDLLILTISVSARDTMLFLMFLKRTHNHAFINLMELCVDRIINNTGNRGRQVQRITDLCVGKST